MMIHCQQHITHFDGCLMVRPCLPIGETVPVAVRPGQAGVPDNAKTARGTRHRSGRDVLGLGEASPLCEACSQRDPGSEDTHEAKATERVGGAEDQFRISAGP